MIVEDIIMKKRQFLFKHHALFILLAAMAVVCQPNQTLANDTGIYLGTAQWVDNLNPFTYTSYPAELIIQFSTIRLIQHVCTGSDIEAYRAIVQKKFNQYTIEDIYKPLDSQFHLDLNKDYGIHYQDINYSLEQIKKSPINRYHEHDMAFLGNIIEIEHPRSALFDKAAAALTFPIIKHNTLLDYSTEIKGNDHINVYNSFTTGIYQLSSFNISEIKLTNRKPDPDIHPLTFKIDTKWEIFFKNLLDKKVHIGLSVSGDLMDRLKDSYQLEETDDLNSFTYFGFNYRPNNPRAKRIRKLFQDIEFRQAFAFAIASNNSMKELVNTYGNNMRYTFDAMRRIKGMKPSVDYSGNMGQKVSRFVRALYQPDELTLRILYRPGLIFSADHLKDLKNALDAQFEAANIRFKLISAPVASEFEDKKEKKNFEIIFDTYVYGQNKLRYIEFMNPENKKINFLSCHLFEPEEIKNYKEKVEKRDEFLLRVNRELPVFVLGRLSNKNAISTAVQRDTSCQNGGRKIPFTDIHKWGLLQQTTAQ